MTEKGERFGRVLTGLKATCCEAELIFIVSTVQMGRTHDTLVWAEARLGAQNDDGTWKVSINHVGKHDWRGEFRARRVTVPRL